MLPSLGFLALALVFHVVACDWWVDPEYLWTFREVALPENAIYYSSTLMITHAPSLSRFQGEFLGLGVPALLCAIAVFFMGYDRGWKRGRSVSALTPEGGN